MTLLTTYTISVSPPLFGCTHSYHLPYHPYLLDQILLPTGAIYMVEDHA